MRKIYWIRVNSIQTLSKCSKLFFIHYLDKMNNFYLCKILINMNIKIRIFLTNILQFWFLVHFKGFYCIFLGFCSALNSQPWLLLLYCCINWCRRYLLLKFRSSTADCNLQFFFSVFCGVLIVCIISLCSVLYLPIMVDHF